MTLAGCTALSSPTTYTNEAAWTISPETDGLTDAEPERYVDRMADHYGAWAADEIVSETVTLVRTTERKGY